MKRSAEVFKKPTYKFNKNKNRKRRFITDNSIPNIAHQDPILFSHERDRKLEEFYKDLLHFKIFSEEYYII